MNNGPRMYVKKEDEDGEDPDLRKQFHMTTECLTNLHLNCSFENCPCICHRDPVIKKELSKRYVREGTFHQPALRPIEYEMVIKPEDDKKARYMERLYKYLTSPAWSKRKR